MNAWYWQDFGGGFILMEEDAWRSCVLSQGPRSVGIVVNTHGVLKPITPDHPTAKKIAAVPELIEFAQAFLNSREPSVVKMTNAQLIAMAQMALEKAGT